MSLAVQNSSPNIPNTSRQTLQWTSCLMMGVPNTTFAPVRLLSSPQSSDQLAGCRVLILVTVYNNFEIADMEYWRGEAFSAYFDFLDQRRLLLRGDVLSLTIRLPFLRT
jgi:hypothetical protein